MPRFLLLPLAIAAVLGCARTEPAAPPPTESAPEVARARTALAPKRLPQAPMPRPAEFRLAVVEAERIEPDLTIPDPDLGVTIDPAIPAVPRVDLERIDEKVVQDPIGRRNEPPAKLVELEDPLAKLAEPDPKDAKGATVFAGRTGATKAMLLKQSGGTADTEKAVALGLGWLARQQKADGGWEFDAEQYKKERTCATGMAVLAYLGAGVTHKKGAGADEPKHAAVVQKGLDFLKKNCPPTGPNAGRLSTDVYANGIAALALCEAYALTSDPSLKPHAQAAANFIQRTQGPNGSWGYGNAGNGDTSITGWQLQALFAAKQGKLVVNDAVVKKAMKFLDLAAEGPDKERYGYNDNAGANPGTSLTAIGLLSRHRHDGWGPDHKGLMKGAEGLLKRPLVANQLDPYFLYYATQVLHAVGGDAWKTWNEGKAPGKGGLRDVLTAAQKKDGDHAGSWDPGAGILSTSCGRLGTTCMYLLTLEVYYRHLPLFKREAKPEGK